jgi:hypothetical protein
MSNWKNKTPEEKVATLQKIKDNEQQYKSKQTKLNEEDTKKQHEIFARGKLPARCLECGITTSHHYTLVMMNTPFGGPFSTALGKCVTCNKEIKAIVDPRIVGLDASFIIANILVNLGASGNLVDERKEKVREWS